MQYLADWTVIKAHKQQLIHKNNIIENSKCIPYQYKVGDMVMLETTELTNMNNRTKCTYLITQVNMKGAVHLKIGAVTDTINIRHIHPYKMTSSNSNHGGKCSMHRSHWAGKTYMITNHEFQICFDEHMDVYHFM